ncbi:MAG: 6,7-dimethyl-8-ribityllumazine synthase [Chlorobi bacterium]|jgi:6,7-dimethyl-8-ribityllumazine synthase|nr:6,7-dimethyl-8-ribityllumazine synthase [Chlorobiota bacterium]
MPKTLRGLLNADGSRFAIAVSRWNEFITQRLLEGAMECIQMHGGDLNNVTIVYVPGAFELPLATKRLAESGNYDAVIVLGAVIRGGTPHFNYVAGEAVKGISNAMMATNVPCTFGVLTVDTIEQAIERAGTKAGNKGWEAAQTAIEMVSLLKQL